MADLILIDGDTVNFLPTFGAAIVVTKPGTLTGSGPGTLRGKKLCVSGDESGVQVAGCDYMTPQYSIPGKGTLKIKALAADQLARKTRTGSKEVLLKGSQFTATFEVASPAQQPNPSGPPIPDATPQYSGQGMFETQNAHFRGE